MSRSSAREPRPKQARDNAPCGDSIGLERGARAVDRFIAAAREAGARVTFNKAEGATHNSAAWRARFQDALAALYAGG